MKKRKTSAECIHCIVFIDALISSNSEGFRKRAKAARVRVSGTILSKCEV